MLTAILERWRIAAVGTMFVRVIDGNEAARHLYDRIGFVSSNHRQPLTARPGCSEEKLILPLA
jgi:hypothetical protein